VPSMLHRVRDYLMTDNRSLGPVYAYGFLCLLLALLAWQVKLVMEMSADYPGNRYTGIIVISMGLLNHLAWVFRWPDRFKLVLRVISAVWTVFALVYVVTYALR
jgi:hypothetical protein